MCEDCVVTIIYHNYVEFGKDIERLYSDCICIKS